MKLTPLRRKTPLRAKTRLRAKPKPPLPDPEREHMARVATMGCLVCGRPATVHHVTGYADRPGRFARSARLVVPLCNSRPEPHHQKVFDSEQNPTTVEGLSHRGFFAKYGIDLKARAEQLWSERAEQLWSESCALG